MISVCMATHNGGKYIYEQMSSILNQIGLEDEVIVSDDASSDNTLDIIKSFNDSRVKILNHKSISGLPGFLCATANFENALQYAHGDYIFLSDQDDVWASNKVEVSLQYLKDYDYIVSDAYVADKNLNILSETRFLKEEKIHRNKYLALVLATPYQGSCAAFRRCVLEKSSPFPKGIQSHDRWIGNVAAFYFKIKIIPEKLIYYRRHEGVTSNSVNGDGRPSGFFKTVVYKLKYIQGLISIYGK